MASIKVKFRPSAASVHEGTIYYQVIHNRKIRRLSTDYHLMAHEWDKSRATVKAPDATHRTPYVLYVRERIRIDTERLARIARKLDAEQFTYTADEIVNEFQRQSNEVSLACFMRNLIHRFRQNGKPRTAETYTAALNSFQKFLRDTHIFYNDDISLFNISSEIMESYEAWHKKQGNSPNTISFYTRILRAVYNRAVENDIIENRQPFRRVYTGVDKTVKRAISLQHISTIKTSTFPPHPHLSMPAICFCSAFSFAE